ncbi:putative Ig domain-containing protein [Glycomyces sp. NPDC047010]|uniref:putative Ig domain-containing protein n=1 Tax=Glycomyces sp. NPDC047010 TaxID=3155023 RepID=UPI003400AEBF
MTHTRQRKRLRPLALAAALATAVGLVALPQQSAQAVEYSDLITENVVAINETVSDEGFVHPGVGLTAEDLRNAQTQARAGVEPWASYFTAMADTSFASTTYRASNSKSAAQPDVPLDPTFTQVGLRYRETNDSFGALTQALMWTITGDEVYRRNAIQALRTWGGMDPTKYAYFPDAHIHTGHPLYQFLMAAEIIRATEPVDDDTHGEYGGYDVIWSEEDDADLLTNFANPVVETFLYSNTKWMNQHNFGLFGRIATAIYADDAEGYAKGVEWFTVNATYDGYDNGSMAAQMPLIDADDPLNPYGTDFVQVREMGRDQAHGECNIDNFTGLARMLEVQGTTVDPTAGTVSDAADAVSAYDFLDRRLLDGADTFFGFMMGQWMPWTDERGDGWNGTISEAYRGRLFNPVNELYYEYAYERGVDVETEAPWLAELASRMDGPYYYYGTGVANFWGPGDKNPEYWVAFPEELAGTGPTPVPDDAALTFERIGTTLDEDTELVTEDGETFARATLSEAGTTTAVSRLMYGTGAVLGLRYRSDGPARLEVRTKEEASGINPDEYDADSIAVRDLPDTGGEWRYITYPAGGSNTHFYRLTGAAGDTVDLHSVILSAATDLTAPQFAQTESTFYLTAREERAVDLSAVDTGGNVAYTVQGLPDGAEFDAATGLLQWTPAKTQSGRYDVVITADDGETVASRAFELVVSKNRIKTVDAIVADGTDRGAVYTTVSREPYRAALDAAKQAAEDGTQEEFEAAVTALLDAVKALKLLNPRLDGMLDYRFGVVKATGLDATGVNNLADGTMTSIGDLRTASFVYDFGPQYRVTVDGFAFQARFTFGNRMEGTNVYGSTDGVHWDLLTERPAANTNEWDRVDVVDEHRGKQYRYLKAQVDEPGIPTDPAYPGIWSFANLAIDGDRTEVRGDIDTVSVSSPDAVSGRVTEGDAVTVAFTSRTEITDVTVDVGGSELTAASDDGRNWTATGTVGPIEGSGLLDVAIDHTTAKGRTAATVHGATDGTYLYGADESDLIDLADFTVVDTAGEPDAAKATQAARMLDGNPATFADIGPVDGAYSLIWDAGEGSTFDVDRLDFLALANNNGMLRLPGLVFEGSDDLSDWTALTDPPFKTYAWQNVDADGGAYRYLRITNTNWINITELRVYGTVALDLDPILARADAVDLTSYTRGSQILFPREVAAVRAAASEPDADETALARRLLDAWDLLDPAADTAPAVLDPTWVTASTASADGTAAAANGWRMFDGDTGTYTDTTTKSCTDTVLPTDGTAFEVLSVRYHPRSNAVSRATGMPIQGSTDGGATWTTFANTGTPAAGWNTLTLSEPAAYEALRISGGNGYCNVAELQFIVAVVDKTGIAVRLDDAAALTEAEWTPGSWTALSAARDAAQAAADDKGMTQEEVDTAADDLAAAIAGLVAAG